MNFLCLAPLCTLCLLKLIERSNAQDEFLEGGGLEPDPAYEEYQEGDDVPFQKLHKEGQPQERYQEEYQEGSKIVEPDDDDPNVMERLEPYINRGPPTRGETYKYAATMYTHLQLTRKTVPTTRRTRATVTPTVLWDQYFVRNRLKSRIKVHHIKTHYRREYRARLSKMVNQCVGGVLLNASHHSWDELMDEYRPHREELMIRADDRLFNKFIRRMDTVLQSGRYEKWRFQANTTHKPRFNAEQNLIFTDRVDKKMILEIRSLARSLRKDIHRAFDVIDNQFLRAYFRIPYNRSLYSSYPEPLNYTERF